MQWWQAIVLGVVQGLTEFLPVSSSGHLVLSQQLLGFSEPQLVFDVIVHFATLFAIVGFFRKEILKLRLQQLVVLVVGSIPAAFVGIFMKDFIEALFASSIVVGVALIVTGGINLYSDKRLEAEKARLNESDDMKLKELDLSQVSPTKALIIGTFQAFAIIPGISRSGSTLAGGLFQNLNRQTAFTFSFLLSVPAVAGATLLQVLDVYEAGSLGISVSVLVLGAVAAFVSGYASLSLFKKIISDTRLEMFAYYCFVVGGLSIVLSMM